MNILKEFFDGSALTKGLFGGLGEYAGGLGETFGIQGKDYGVQGADNLPKFDAESYFQMSSYFDPLDFFNADSIANDTLAYAVRKAMGNG